MYAMLCTRPDICYAVGMISRYQSNPGSEHWVVVKHIFKYLRRTMNHMLVYSSPIIVPVGYTDSDFQADKDSRKSTSGSLFTLGGGAIIWRSIKQSCIANSTMEAKYVASFEAAKEAVWLKKFLMDIEVVPVSSQPMTLYCDNNGVKRAQLQALRREYEILQMKEGEGVDEYFARTLTIVNKMKAHSEKMDQTIVVKKILRSMTTKFDYVVCSIKESNDLATMTIDEL
ncbi:cysteine-rich RLK (RECEPTOR-like protein kinase) 8 [Abeliophyllum distichum]|uniref:Cysteine-rich RLK (RECEPTOR-like protein kinase) 8 n=1 Tax=Abeliophyllum distichum TaxID=126358 RepID=A0ABD1QXD0_9LAMI